MNGAERVFVLVWTILTYTVGLAVGYAFGKRWI